MDFTHRADDSKTQVVLTWLTDISSSVPVVSVTVAPSAEQADRALEFTQTMLGAKIRS